MTALSKDGGPAFGAHAFIWAGEWTREGAERVISGAAEVGLDFVEIPLLDPTSIDVEHTRSLLDRYGLGCSCSLGLPLELHLPSNPEGARRFLEGALEATAALGSPVLTGCLYTHVGTLTGKPPEPAELGIVARTLKQVARRAAEYGVELGIEAINRYETYLVNLASQADELLNRIDEPNVFVHLDTYHMNIEEKGFYEPIVSLGSRLGYIHLSESDRGTPGTANVHWDEVFRGLEDIDYGGDLAMESFAAVNEDLIGATALWRDVVGNPDILVRDGIAFLRAKGKEHGVLG
ncbi:MAG: D-tagatose 3-epimerase [uncultured Rubrobacteraceae bacterium]|uniref:D-tagatose 3-epimerase n=1 Tax=uncultured Rubrobacteraceae bacterium TaxID=349277 RepID=A0A6J4QML4_9ACTN|nr:MAG: D-tagatose 3-epimerase [uncultured Rubrobacteraceae bacterium]